METESDQQAASADVLSSAAHAARLIMLNTIDERIRYACEALVEPSTSDVLAFLMTYGVVTDPKRDRSHVAAEVGKWRKERGLSDTGDLPRMSVELLTELDGRRAAEEAATATDPQTEPSKAPADTPAAQTAQVTEAPVSAKRTTPEGSRGFYLVAFMSLLVSVDTSWRFFGDKLGITTISERAAMFAVVEVALIACGFAMRAGIRGPSGKPGPARLILWALCAASGYMAFDLAGPVSGLARVTLGPVLGVVMLHLALGIELRHRRRRVSTWARVSRELKERCLSRLGLGDDERDALARTRDRAARRAAHLARASWFTPFRKVRLARALRSANAAHDDRMRSRLMAELAAVQHADELRRLDLASPWSDSLTNTLKYLKR
ncbi:hypothetical protein LWP59_16315 [Amycolatopsis acidiphila]|uniref:DUF2637 domain-containing protein n=1 Tax=Amycolatopsis acidiphila TaxID=715473 RepID=A0A557ZYU7_9PSEU|nr:hypothetical protein [Amycolatopsis acidiphila]TVT17161.1 hypothetical protein FNH06_32415 [Amycolatopsis acidiphila]UIJ63080.1 hypothetical protein LWP59_16315 [Amycolatopsis acidiphila]GHG66016.1 hypothetical protein GCM10017788_23960 [Amycolatopsis acidiphila]